MPSFRWYCLCLRSLSLGREDNFMYNGPCFFSLLDQHNAKQIILNNPGYVLSGQSELVIWKHCRAFHISMHFYAILQVYVYLLLMEHSGENKTFDLCPFFLPVLCFEMWKVSKVITGWIEVTLLFTFFGVGWRIWETSGCWHFRVWTKSQTLRRREEETEMVLAEKCAYLLICWNWAVANEAGCLENRFLIWNTVTHKIKSVSNNITIEFLFYVYRGSGLKKSLLSFWQWDVKILHNFLLINTLKDALPPLPLDLFHSS